MPGQELLPKPLYNDQQTAELTILASAQVSSYVSHYAFGGLMQQLLSQQMGGQAQAG
jgi:hypothetical protein